jgi:DNA uptake protein ComE-like DNA-binding protein
MKSFLKPFISWFGYSGRERRASMILLIIMGIVLVLRYTIPERTIEIRDMSALLIPEAEESVRTGSFNTDTSVNKITKDAAGIIRKNRYASPTKKMELNICDSADLERLPGIGPVLSARIIKYRNLLGGYVSVEQLKEVYGLPDSTYLIICSRVSADSTLVSKININSATFSELNRHPYIERYDVQGILKYRELKGRIERISDLIDNKIMTGERALKILPYLRFD